MNLLIIIFIVVIGYLLYEAFRSHKAFRYYVFPNNIDEEFGERVSEIINKSDWNKQYDIRNTNKKTNANIFISLEDRSFMDQWHSKKEYYPDGKEIRFSITHKPEGIPSVHIDGENWKNGVAESGLNKDEYREYVINHELGHALGKDHMECNKDTMQDGRCPVMYQSTRGCPEGIKCGYAVNKNDFEAPEIGW